MLAAVALNILVDDKNKPFSSKMNGWSCQKLDLQDLKGE